MGSREPNSGPHYCVAKAPPLLVKYPSVAIICTLNRDAGNEPGRDIRELCLFWLHYPLDLGSSHVISKASFLLLFLTNDLVLFRFFLLWSLCSPDPGPGVPSVTVHNTTDKRSKCCSSEIFLTLGRIEAKVHEILQPHQLQGLGVVGPCRSNGPPSRSHYW